MEIPEILAQLEWPGGRFPSEAVDAAVALRAEITPELLRVLDETIEQAEEVGENGNYMGHMFAMCLLAQFRETRAYPVILRVVSLPGKAVDLLLGDFITEGLGSVLASVCGGNLAGIKSLIENDEADEWVRGAAIHSLVILVAAGQMDRAGIVNYFASLFRGRLIREYSPVWDALVGEAADLCPLELTHEIEKAYRDGLVDPSFISLREVQDFAALGEEGAIAALAKDPNCQLVTDTARELSWMACFEARPAAVTPPAVTRSIREPAPPVIAIPPKTGRNDPCPCGSGKKFKKCHGA